MAQMHRETNKNTPIYFSRDVQYTRDEIIEKFDSPKTGARMYDPVTRGLLPDSLLHEGLLATE